MQITYQTFIKHHSYLDNRYRALLASIRRLESIGFMPTARDRGQNLGHILLLYLNNWYYFSVNSGQNLGHLKAFIFLHLESFMSSFHFVDSGASKSRKS